MFVCNMRKEFTHRAFANKFTLFFRLRPPYTRPLSINVGFRCPVPLPLLTLLKSSASLLFTLLKSPGPLCVRQIPSSFDPVAANDDRNDLCFLCVVSLSALNNGAPKS